ncbi:hypothetical protein FOCC_FOCC014651, partial [Frankliniella occidentalis]
MSGATPGEDEMRHNIEVYEAGTDCNRIIRRSDEVKQYTKTYEEQSRREIEKTLRMRRDLLHGAGLESGAAPQIPLRATNRWTGRRDTGRTAEQQEEEEQEKEEGQEEEERKGKENQSDPRGDRSGGGAAEESNKEKCAHCLRDSLEAAERWRQASSSNQACAVLGPGVAGSPGPGRGLEAAGYAGASRASPAVRAVRVQVVLETPSRTGVTTRRSQLGNPGSRKCLLEPSKMLGQPGQDLQQQPGGVLEPPGAAGPRQRGALPAAFPHLLSIANSEPCFIWRYD